MSWLQRNWQGLAPWILFVVLYIATFKLAWRKLADLVVSNVTRRHGVSSWRFWWQFVEYRLILLAPYLPFLIFRQHVPTTISKIILWWVVLVFVLGLLRFVGSQKVISALWWIYGYLYDGLLNFYPYRNLIASVVDRMELKDGMCVLELGCGTGNVIVSALDEADIKVIGVDSSKSMIRQAKRKLNASIEKGKVEIIYQDAYDYLRSVPSNSFDCISMVNFLYAVKDRAAIWQECLRILKPRGRIVITTSTKTGSKPIIHEHLIHARWAELVSLRLVGVVIVDFFISELAKSGPFTFASQQQLLSEVKAAGGYATNVDRVYGGSDEGVNIVFNVGKFTRFAD